MLAGSAALFALVMVLFALVIWRPGWGSGVSPTRWIVLGGLVLPAVVLTPLVAYALIAGERLLPLPGASRRESRPRRSNGSGPSAIPTMAGSRPRTSCTCPRAFLSTS